ncbi:unnamed protein product [Owenia fusiformis]|uniref:Uncharacterized protein n=1 Tax=Owenia fusiformis TaxID=6347 RepID=A0A8J1T7M0_OWEFU|nr:unnamed protein product [Owenia fusiformis]
MVMNDSGIHENATSTESVATYFQEDPALHYAYFISLCATTLVGNIGNILVIGAVYCDRTLRSCFSNIFIVNLAVADLCVTMIVDPMSIMGVIVGDDFFNENTTLCHFVGSICVTSCVCSLWSITAISINRYVLICKNQLYRVIYSHKNCLIMCCGLWLAAFALDIPNFTDWGNHAYDLKTMACSYDRLASYSYTVFFIIMFVTMPLLTVLFCNINIFVTVRKSKLKIKTHRNKVQPATTSTDFTIRLQDDDVSVELHNSEAITDEHRNSEAIKDERHNSEASTDERHNSEAIRDEHHNSEAIINEPDLNRCSNTGTIAKPCGNDNEDGVQSRNDLHGNMHSGEKDSRSHAKKGVSFHMADGRATMGSLKEYRSSRSNKVKNSDVKLAKTLVIVFIVFAVCWAPYALICLIDPNDIIPKAAYVVAIQLAHSSSSINSILYAALNKNFRNGYKRFLRNVFCFCRKLKKQM